MESDATRVVYMHGFSEEEISRIMRGVRSVVADPGSVAFCMSTEKNVEWQVKALLADVTEEHEYLRRNPPEKSEPKPE